MGTQFPESTGVSAPLSSGGKDLSSGCVGGSLPPQHPAVRVIGLITDYCRGR